MILTNLGWFVLHAAWEDTFVFGLAAFALGLMARRSARARYALLGAALALAAIAPLLTAITRAWRADPRVPPLLLRSLDGIVDVPTWVATGLNVLPWLGGIWIAGVCAGFVRMIVEWRRTLSVRAGSHRALALDDLRPAAGPAAALDLRASAAVNVPMLIGWRRPAVIVPERLPPLTRAEWQSVVAHEIAHLRRGDYAANLTQTIVDRLLFFHPAARWLSVRLRIEREYCCDDEVIAGGCAPRTYLRALEALESSSDGALALAATSGSLLDRVERLAGAPRRVLTAGRAGLILAGATALAAALLALAMTLPPGLPAGTKMKRRMPPPAASPAIPATPRVR